MDRAGTFLLSAPVTGRHSAVRVTSRGASPPQGIPAGRL